MSRRLITSSITALAGLALVAGSAIVAAPSASALLCGYPPKQCAPGQINPSRTAELAPDIYLVSDSRARSRITSKPRVNINSGTTLTVTRRRTVAPSVSGLPDSVPFIVSVKLPGGGNAGIGVVKTDSQGRVILPALSLGSRHSVTVTLRSASGQTYSIKLKPRG